MDKRPSRGERRRERRRQEDRQLAEDGSCQLMTSLVLYPVGSLAAFVVVLTGTRLTPVTLDRFGRTRGATVESMRLGIQDLNGGPVSALEMVIVAAVIFVIVPALLWYVITRRPQRVLRVMFFYIHPKFEERVRRHRTLGAVQLIGAIAVLTLGLWLPMPLALAIVWALPL